MFIPRLGGFVRNEGPKKPEETETPTRLAVGEVENPMVACVREFRETLPPPPPPFSRRPRRRKAK